MVGNAISTQSVRSKTGESHSLETLGDISCTGSISSSPFLTSFFSFLLNEPIDLKKCYPSRVCSLTAFWVCFLVLFMKVLVLMSNLLGCKWFCTGSCFGVIWGSHSPAINTESWTIVMLMNCLCMLCIWKSSWGMIKICEISAPK